MKKVPNMIKIVGGIFILVVIALFGVATFNIISTQDDFVLSVDKYVCNKCSESNSRQIGPFEESITFDFEILNSVREDDVFMYVVDANEQKKLLFQQRFTPVCGGARGYILKNFKYNAKVEISHDTNVIYMKNAISKENINFITKSSSFGQEPLRIEFVVFEQRTTVCGLLQGGYVKQGQIKVSNVIIKDYPLPEPEIIEEELPIIKEELIEETGGEMIVEQNDKNNKLTGFVTIGGTTFRPIIAYLIFGIMISLIVGTVIYNRRSKKRGI